MYCRFFLVSLLISLSKGGVNDGGFHEDELKLLRTGRATVVLLLFDDLLRVEVGGAQIFVIVLGDGSR